MKNFKGSSFSNIKSKEIMKEMLSYLKMNKVLGLIKFNKRLQNRLDITKKVFETFAEPIRLIYKKNENIEKSLDLPYSSSNGLWNSNDCTICGNSCCYGIYFIYLLVYAILLVAKDGFNETNTKNDSKDSIKIIDTINKCLFALVGIAIISYIFITFYACKISEDDIDCKRNLKLIMMLIFIAIHFIFEILIIYKLAISYKIKTISATWFMSMDIVFIVFNALFIACSVYEFIYYYRKTIPTIEDRTRIILNSINDIEIEEYDLPVNYDSFSKREQKQFILEYLNEIKVSFKVGFMITTYLNKERTKLAIPPIIYDNEYILRDFMLIMPSEAFFFNYKYIFRLDDNIYLIKSSLQDISKKIENGDKELLKIICNDKLTNFSAMNKKGDRNTLYIYLWGENNFSISNKKGKKGYIVDIMNKYKNREYKDNIIDIELKDYLEENLIEN